MGFLSRPKIVRPPEPAPPPVPPEVAPPPTPADPAVLQSRRDQRREAARRAGRSGTILTGPRGILEEEEDETQRARPTLLGT
jgi:hypothetical protein